MTVTRHGVGSFSRREPRLYKIASTVVAQAVQSTQQANNMSAKQKAGLMRLAPTLGTVSAPLAPDATL